MSVYLVLCDLCRFALVSVHLKEQQIPLLVFKDSFQYVLTSSLLPGLIGLPLELHSYHIGAGCDGATVCTVGSMVGRFVIGVSGGLGSCLVPEGKIV